MNRKSPKQDEYLNILELEMKELRSVLKSILELYPYLNCVCGRNKPRIPDKLRKQAHNILNQVP